MASIQSLPRELIIAILKHLNPFDLLSVLQTFNKALYTAADPLFRPHRAWVQNAQVMVALFPPQSTHSSRRLCPSYPSHIPIFDDDCVSLREEIARKDYAKLSLEPDRGPYIRCSPPDLITWMELDGSFGWLEPLDKNMAATMDGYNGSEGDRPMAQKSEVDALVKQASELGLKLPAGFESFLRSDRLHHRFPSYSAWYFRLSNLIKCPASIDDGQGGYLCRFHFDQQCCAFAYLYLSLSGGHCVLVSGIDAYVGSDEDDESPNGSDAEESDEESIDAGNFDKDDFSIAGLSFEEYLVTVYYEGLLSFEAEPFEGLESFVKHVYRSPREAEHMRETNEAIKLFLDAQNWKGTEHHNQLIRD